MAEVEPRGPLPRTSFALLLLGHQLGFFLAILALAPASVKEHSGERPDACDKGRKPLNAMIREQPKRTKPNSA